MDAILADHHTAAMDERLRAMLMFLEKVTREPDRVEAADAARLRRAGVSEAAARDALYVGYIFAIHTRLADVLGYQLQTDDYMQTPKAVLSRRGYQL